MKFKLEIDLDNSVFESQDFASERDGVMIGITLKQIAQQIDYYGSVSEMRAPVRDFNGNTCGHWQITEEK